MARIRQVRPSLAVHIPFASSTRTVPTKPGLQKDLHLPLGDLTTSLAGSTALGSSRLKGKGSDGDLAHSTGVQRMLMKAKVVAADVTKSSPPLRGSPASSNGSKRFPSSDSYLPHDQSKLVVTTKSSVPQTHDPHGGHSMVKGHSGQGGLPGHLRSGWSAAATYLGSAMHAKPVEVHAASPEEKIATFVAPTGRSASRARASRPQVVRSHTGSSAGLKASVSPVLSKTSSSTSPTPQSSTRSSPSLDAPLPSSVSPGLRITTSPVATPLPPRDRSPVRFVMKVDGPDAMLHSPSPLGARGNVTHARDIEKIRMKVPNLDVPTAPILRSCAHERNLDFKLQKMSTPERAAAAAREAKLAKLLGTAQFESPSLLGARAKAPHKHQTSLEVAGVALSPLSAPAPFPSMTGGYRRKGSHLREVANPMDGFFQPLADRSPLPSPPPSGEGPHFEFQNATFGLQAPDIRLSPPPSPLSPRSLAPHSEGGTLVGQRSKAF
ncbi:hypothetical protein CBOM_06907 [Ceraceosorus bombacis]|uniref:Uncharacterized protein n=1 Tax=Ceraceosorus bombacis TaxID=401625 RepID=A0A0P1BSR9_9BASI|nr:hypothetical protein CBOM_06907 [Ceraceosorus bombacis]